MTPTPEQTLRLARRNIQGRLRALSDRALKFDPDQVERMHQLLDQFREEWTAARHEAADANRRGTHPAPPPGPPFPA